RCSSHASPTRLHRLPTRRSSDLGEVAAIVKLARVACLVPVVIVISALCRRRGEPAREERPPLVPFFLIGFICMMVANSLYLIPSDRKSTRLNSSHVKISYAVFCL